MLERIRDHPADPAGKSTHLRQDRRAGGTTATRPVGRPGNGTIPGRQDPFLPSCREQRRANCPGMAPTTHPARKRGRHLPGQRVRGHEKALVGNLNCASFRRLLVTIHNFNDVAVIVPDGVAHPFTRSTLYVRDTNLVFFRTG